MIRSSVFALVALSALAVACVAPTDREDLGRVASAAAEEPTIDSGLEDPSEPIVDIPGLPPGYVVPRWGSCSEDGSRAPRAFVKVDPEHRTKEDPCPVVKGENGIWIGAPVASYESGFCSYSWLENSYSEFFRLPEFASRTAVNRNPDEAVWEIPTRADVRPDCAPEPSPCVLIDDRFDCHWGDVIADVVMDSMKLQKGMSPCGACGELLHDGRLLVVLPEWFAKIDRAGGVRDLLVSIREPDAAEDAPVRTLTIVQPEGDPAFVVKLGDVKPGMKIFVSR